MIFYKKTILRKLIFILFILALILVAFSMYLFFFGSKEVPYFVLLICAIFYSILFVLIYYRDIVLPLRALVTEMQALLTGSQFKAIYTDRIDEIGIIAYFFNQVIKSLSKVSFDIKDRQRILEELSVASQIQRDILPLKNPSVKGLSIVAKNRPASEIGGDSFNIITVKDKAFIYVGDVTGHGIASALIMTMVSSLISVFAETYANAFDIVRYTNKYIKKYVKKAMYMTMVLLAWDINLKKLTFVGAGHEHILVYRKAIGKCEAIVSSGVALGMVPDNSALIKEKEIYLDDGDFVVLYSDGITEARNINEELYGLERLVRAVENYATEFSAEGLNYKIAMDVSTFMKGHVQLDDMTLIVIQKISDTISFDSTDTPTNWV
ncbi:MAG: SpoIIE family protein phosphatase [Candidatus Gracilibacteria bacterium]|jgi:hypothetical protein|nr:SpoIIE family protein phosphatase [Candidatus Gracilibacteria bacterium]